MKKSRFSEEQIVAILKQQEAGMKTAELCRQHAISPATFYQWKAKYGGLEVSEAQRLRQLEEENRKLKRIVADQAMDIVMLRDLPSKNSRAWGQESDGGASCRDAPRTRSGLIATRLRWILQGRNNRYDHGYGDRREPAQHHHRADFGCAVRL